MKLKTEPDLNQKARWVEFNWVYRVKRSLNMRENG